MSKYGRQFSILKIPYAFKLLIQELQSMNIQMRLITEDNIDQLTSMAYSNNILKLRHDETISGAVTSDDLKLSILSEVQNRKNVLREGSTYDIKEPAKMNEPIEQPTKTMPIEPEAYGWSYYSYDEERGEAYKSILLNNKGDATEIWFVGENDGQLPNRYPAGWNVKSLTYNDKTPIEPNVMIEELNNTQEPNNWNISLDAIRREDKGKLFALGAPLVSPISQDYPPSMSPDYPPPMSPDYPPPMSPDYPPPM